MSKRRQVVHNNFKFTWEIKEFLKHVEKNSFDLDSLQFNVKCIDITTWYAELIPVFIKNDCQVSCCLNRLANEDELNTIVVNLTTAVTDERGNLFFRTNIPRIIMDKEVTEIHIKNVIGSARYLETLHCLGSLFFHFNLDIFVEPMDTYSFNFSPELQNLSMDLTNLYKNEALREATIYVGDTLFFAHLFVMHARWPNFSEYHSKFPKLVSKSDLQAFSNINFEILILAAISIKSNYMVLESDCLEEMREVIEIFNPEMFYYLLYYVYTGKGRNVEENRKPNLVRLCRLFDFERLIQKYNETPIASTCLTRAPLDRYIFDWSQEDGKNWERNNFQPFVQILECHKNQLSMIELQFTIEENDFFVNLRYLEGVNLVSVSCVVILKDNDGFENKTFHYNRFARREIWPVRVGMTKDDIPFKSFTIEVIIHCSYESKITERIFSLTAENTNFSQALHQYRCDFWELFVNKRMTDVALIAEGKVFNVHKYMLCARSSQFRKELQGKLKRTHTFTHMIHGIKHQVLEKILECIYTGVVDIEVEDMKGFRQAATKYNLRHLME